MKGRRQLSRGKRKKFMMLLVAVAIIVNPPRDRNLLVRPRTDSWIAMTCTQFSEKEWRPPFSLELLMRNVANVWNEMRHGSGDCLLEIQNYGSVPVFTRARTNSRLGPSRGKNVERLGFIFNVYTVKIIRAVLLFWICGPCLIRAVPQVDSDVNGA